MRLRVRIYFVKCLGTRLSLCSTRSINKDKPAGCHSTRSSSNNAELLSGQKVHCSCNYWLFQKSVHVITFEQDVFFSIHQSAITLTSLVCKIAQLTVKDGIVHQMRLQSYRKTMTTLVSPCSSELQWKDQRLNIRSSYLWPSLWQSSITVWELMAFKNIIFRVSTITETLTYMHLRWFF